MARSLQLALTILARDNGSKVLRKALEDAVAKTKAAEKAGDDLAKSQQQNSSQGIRASRALSEEFKRANSARSTLGIRSEREIQREIQQTIAAYSRLTRMGVMSASEQSRAFSAMTDRVSRLRGELNATAQSVSRMEKLRAVGSGAMAVAGGVAAATMVIKDPVQRQMAFESKNAEIANTAYNALSPAERIKKIPVINDTIREAVRYGGGTPEAAQATLGALFAGGLDEEAAIKMLPDITKYATASGASPEHLAQIGIGAIKNFGIKAEDLPAVYDKAIRSGENGKYELADMAGSLSLTMTKANSVGMSGLNDLDKLLAMLQANAETAGDNSAASTNVNNLLDKYTSADTQNAMKGYKFRMKDGRTVGYTDYMAEKRLQGVSASDAFTGAVDGIVSSDKRVQKLRAAAEKYKGTDKEADILASLDLVVSSITSKIVADQQAGMALKTSILKKDFITEQIAGTKNAAGAGADSFAVVSSTAGYKSQQFESEKLFAEQDSVKPLADWYGDLVSNLTNYSKEYPGLTTALSGATTGIKALGAGAVTAGGVLAAWKLISGSGGVNPPPVPGGPTTTPNVPGTRLPPWLSRLGSVARVAGRIASPLALYQAAEDAPLVQVERGDAAARTRLNANEYASDLERIQDSRRAVPGFLDVVDELKTWWARPTTIGADVNPATMGVPSYLLPQQPQNNQPIQINTKVELDSRVIAEAVNEVNSQQATRGSNGAYQ
ncbi:phage tail tape measure protein [Pectobacterium brasiliense]|uniref:phage tail tape measure protein n=1 Tax=Pectobacterium brasiliense TaxID=180957 RepID=UPI00196930DE|nr:phage tail tape measure protein [Pectobacterium brasiliense]MBN3068149.1 phage tail tape measure protein [Pectobacterium brasiliense]